MASAAKFCVPPNGNSTRVPTLLKSMYLGSFRHELKLSAVTEARMAVIKYILFFIFFNYYLAQNIFELNGLIVPSFAKLPGLVSNSDSGYGNLVGSVGDIAAGSI